MMALVVHITDGLENNTYIHDNQFSTIAVLHYIIEQSCMIQCITHQRDTILRQYVTLANN